MSLNPLHSFVPCTIDGIAATAIPGNVQPPAIDIVGDNLHPAAFVSFDGTDLLFRLRLAGNPAPGGQLLPFVWGVALNPVNNPNFIQAFLAVDGTHSLIILTAGVPPLFDQLNAVAAGISLSQAAQFGLSFSSSPTGDGANLGGGTNYFLDWVFPLADLEMVLGETILGLRALFFTSSTPDRITGDVMGSIPASLAGNYGDFYFLENVETPAHLVLASSRLLGPAAILVNQSGTWRIEVTVLNDGGNAALNTVLTGRLLLDTVTGITIVSASQGTVAGHPAQRTAAWNVGTLAPAGSATLVFDVTGSFAAAIGNFRALGEIFAAWLDTFSGTNLASGPVAGFIVLVRGVTAINGVTFKAEGGPLAGAAMTLQDRAGLTLATATSDANGNYSFPNQPDEMYHVLCASAGRGTATLGAAAIEGETPTQVIVMSAIKGRIVGLVAQGGLPVGGVPVTMIREDRKPIASTITAGNGSYAVDDLSPGSYFVRIDGIGGAQTIGAQVLEGQDTEVDFQLPPAVGSLQGTVTDEVTGLPIAGADVQALLDDIPQAAALTPGAGTYAFAGLQPGSYTIQAVAPGYANTNFQVTITPGQTVTQNFALVTSAGQLVGHIFDGATGAPLVAVSVELRRDDGSLVMATETGMDGVFVVYDAEPGNMSLVMKGPDMQDLDVLPLAQGATMQAENRVELAISTKHSDACEDDRASGDDGEGCCRLGSITGTVKSNGAPVAGALVTLRRNGRPVPSSPPL